MDKLRETMWAMNAVDYSTHPETTTIDTTDEDGNPTTTEITETVLVIELTHKTPAEMAADYHFTARQSTYLQLLQDPQYEELWAELLGGFAQGGGELMNPDSTRTPTGTLQWPLPVAGTITSQFGHRVDPITGEVSSHTGTDIACADGTPILAAADGTVTVANGLDSWGGSYGYYIQIDHGGGLETLYAHCSSICVATGAAGAGRASYRLCRTHWAGYGQPPTSGSKNRQQPCGCNAIFYTIKFKRVFDRSLFWYKAINTCITVIPFRIIAINSANILSLLSVTHETAA